MILQVYKIFISYKLFKKNILPKLQIVKKYFKGETKIFFNYLIEMHFNKNQDKLFEFLKYSKRIAPPYVDFINYLGQNITIIDGGIADGKETLGFFKKFNNPIVYAFEPFIKTVNFNNFILNNIPLDLIKVRAEALWKKDEILNFEIKKNSPTTSNITNKGNFKVKGVKIDSFVKYNRIKSVQLIKLDIAKKRTKNIPLTSKDPYLIVIWYTVVDFVSTGELKYFPDVYQKY